jgi:hypothetical protein
MYSYHYKVEGGVIAHSNLIPEELELDFTLVKQVENEEKFIPVSLQKHQIPLEKILPPRDSYLLAEIKPLHESEAIFDFQVHRVLNPKSLLMRTFKWNKDPIYQDEERRIKGLKPRKSQ